MSSRKEQNHARRWVPKVDASWRKGDEEEWWCDDAASSWKWPPRRCWRIKTEHNTPEGGGTTDTEDTKELKSEIGQMSYELAALRWLLLKNGFINTWGHAPTTYDDDTICAPQSTACDQDDAFFWWWGGYNAASAYCSYPEENTCAVAET
jgi:hypothetical protein